MLRVVPVNLQTSNQNHTKMTEYIQGNKVNLRPATMQDRRQIYDWLANSDLTRQVMGPPTYPDIIIPSWTQFKQDYKEYFFDSSQPLEGRCFVIQVNSESIGQINHDKIYPEDNSTELDIWLKSSAYTGKGYGSDAIVTLCGFLNQKYSCKKFILAPSRRNTIAIRSYKKAGFIESGETVRYPDCFDSVALIKTID